MIVALLSWWDEDPAALTACIRSLSTLPLRTVVAVDGPYRMFNHDRSRSSPDQHAAIRDAAHSINANCHVYDRPGAWESEVAKRAFMFRAAEAHAQPGDWYLVIDADVTVIRSPDDLAERLAATFTDVAIGGVLEEMDEQFANVAWSGGDGQLPTIALGRRVKPLRCLFRAIPGLTVRGRHWDYLTPDGRNLWGDCDTQEPGLLVHDLLFDHDDDRPAVRQAAKRAYYHARDAAHIERKPLTAA